MITLIFSFFVYHNEQLTNLESYTKLKVNFVAHGRNCRIKIYFRKGLEMYVYEHVASEGKNSLEFALQQAKLFPTRGKPRPQPLTIVSECSLDVMDVQAR